MDQPEKTSTSRYSELLTGDVCFIDVRAEQEFLKGSVPGAVNLPILNLSLIHI